MDHDASDHHAQGPSPCPPPCPLGDEVFGALVLLTAIRLAGRSLDELPWPEAERVIRLFGRRQVAELLAIDDGELMVPDSLAGAPRAR